MILLHGWPYDIHSYVDVVPRLAAAGYRVIVPYLRGFGSTRFLSDKTVRKYLSARWAHLRLAAGGGFVAGAGSGSSAWRGYAMAGRSRGSTVGSGA